MKVKFSLILPVYCRTWENSCALHEDLLDTLIMYSFLYESVVTCISSQCELHISSELNPGATESTKTMCHLLAKDIKDLRPSHIHIKDLRPSHIHIKDLRPSHIHIKDLRPSRTQALWKLSLILLGFMRMGWDSLEIISHASKRHHCLHDMKFTDLPSRRPRQALNICWQSKCMNFFPRNSNDTPQKCISECFLPCRLSITLIGCMNSPLAQILIWANSVVSYFFYMFFRSLETTSWIVVNNKIKGFHFF
jgi:hypothetical protein